MIRLVNQFDKSTTQATAATPSCCCSCCCCCIATSIISGIATNKILSHHAATQKKDIQTGLKVAAFLSILVGIAAGLLALMFLQNPWFAIVLGAICFGLIQWVLLKDTVPNAVTYAVIMAIIAPAVLLGEVIAWIAFLLSGF